MLAACGSWDPIPALEPLMYTLAESEMCSLESVHACALSLTALLQARLGDMRRATAFLHASMPKILEHAPVRDRVQCECVVAAKVT